MAWGDAHCLSATPGCGQISLLIDERSLCYQLSQVMFLYTCLQIIWRASHGQQRSQAVNIHPQRSAAERGRTFCATARQRSARLAMLSTFSSSATLHLASILSVVPSASITCAPGREPGASRGQSTSQQDQCMHGNAVPDGAPGRRIANAASAFVLGLNMTTQVIQGESTMMRTVIVCWQLFRDAFFWPSRHPVYCTDGLPCSIPWSSASKVRQSSERRL